MVREGRYLTVPVLQDRLEDLDLGGRVRDVVFAADDVRDVEVHVVDAARQRVEVLAVLADEDGVRDRRRVELDGAADHIVPAHGRLLQLEAPVRAAPLRFVRRLLLVRERQRSAVVDRRQAPGAL